MKNTSYLSIIAAVAICLGLLGCSKTDNTNLAANNANKAANSNANSPSNANAKSDTTDIKTDSGSVGSLATPTDAYKTAYELRKKKDIEGLKKVMSKDILDFLKMMGEDDKKSLDDFLQIDRRRLVVPVAGERRRPRIVSGERLAIHVSTLDLRKIRNRARRRPDFVEQF